MSSFSRASTAVSKPSPCRTTTSKDSALPLVDISSLPLDVKDVEACRSEIEIATQESDDIKQQKLEEEYWSQLPRKIQYEKIQDYTPGIPQLAAFLNSDDSFCVWRGFGQLHSRVLMQKTLELNALEAELKDLDDRDDQADETRYRLQIGAHYDGADPKQKDLIEKIACRLTLYDQLMLNYHAIKSIPKPSKSNYESVLRYIWKTRPIYEGHFDFAFKIRDFIRLGRRPQNALFHDRLLRWVSSWSGSRLNKIFRDPKHRQDVATIVEYYCTHRLDFVIKSFINFLIIALLMVPVLLLFLVPMEKSLKVVVVLISLFIFAVSLSLFKDSRPQDMFFGTATYCAVLLVFLAGQTDM